MNANPFQTMAAIRAATLAARARLRDDTIGVTVKDGNARIVRVTYDKRGRSTSVPASDWMPVASVAAALDGVQA